MYPAEPGRCLLLPSMLTILFLGERTMQVRVNAVKEKLNQRFETKDLYHLLGIRIVQSRYIEKIIQRFEMHDS